MYFMRGVFSGLSRRVGSLLWEHGAYFHNSCLVGGKHALRRSLIAILSLIPGIAFGAQLDSNEILRIKFDVPRAYSAYGDNTADMLRFELPLTANYNLINDPGSVITAKLFNGTRLLGTNTITGAQWPYTPSGASLPIAFFSGSEQWPRFPWEPQVAFSSIRDRSINGRIDLSVSRGPLNYQSPSLGVNRDTVEIFNGFLYGPGPYQGSASFGEISEGGVRILSVQELPGPLPYKEISQRPNPIKTDSSPAVDFAKPTVVITHGWQPGGSVPTNGKDVDWVADIKKAIGGNANVLAVTWEDAFTPRPYDSFSTAKYLRQAVAEVKDVGIQLAKELLKLSDEALKNVHLIGHSLGTLVNAYAADVLIKAGKTIEQFTILERPFGNGSGSGLLFDVGIPGFTTGGAPSVPDDLDQGIFRQLLPKGGVKYVDNYYGNGTLFPPATGAALNGDLNALNKLIPGADHSEVHEWYRCAILGLAGSGLNVTGSGCNEFSDSKYGGIGGYNWPANSSNAKKWDPGSTSGFLSRELISDPLALLRLNCDDQLAVDGRYGFTCREGSPAYLWQEAFSVPDDATYLSFDVNWKNRGDGDWLELLFGEDLLFSFLGDTATEGEWINSGLIPLAGLGGKTDQLLFALNNVGDSNAEFSIRNLRIISDSTSVPEPGTLALMLLCLTVLTWHQRNWRIPRVRSRQTMR